MSTEGSLAATPFSPRSPNRTHVFSGTRVEQLLARALGIASVVFGVQSIAIAITSPHGMPLRFELAVLVVVFAALAIVVVAAVTLRAVRTACSLFAIVYLIAVGLWPAASGFQAAGDPNEPWIWYLLTLATACSVVAFPVRLAIAYTVLTPLAYGLARIVGRDGELVTPETGILDATYGMILGGVIVVIGVAFRGAARRVDIARDAALARYNNAVSAHAIESERVEVDAIVHDSVLAALQAAERANSDESERAAKRMAADALDRLRASGAGVPDGDAGVTLRELTAKLSTAALVLRSPFEVTSGTTTGPLLPPGVANSLSLAALQAMVNSVQHADGNDVGLTRPIHRTVDVSVEDGVVSVEIRDDGVGFELAEVGADRLGLSVSIHERMASIGGDSSIDTSPGKGTVVTLVWPRGDAS